MDYDWLKMPNCSYISMPGHPMLPIKSIVEKLPLNSQITQIIAEIENVSLDGNYFIMPALTPVATGSTEPLNMSSPDRTIYGKDELYPNEWYVYHVDNGLDPDSNRRVEYVSFYFYPLRYLPTDQKTLLARHVSLTITYTEPAEEPTVQASLENLIVTSDELEPYAVQLAAYKNITGISSRAVNLTWVYENYGGIDRPEQIRNCIKDFVATYGITYVTIFGDADQVPVRYAFVNDTQVGETYVPTDLYYADLKGTWDDNNDGLYADQRYDNVSGIPDVYVGRIPVTLTEYADYAVAKIMNYTSQDMAGDWTKRVILAAGTGDSGGDSQLGSAPTALNDNISSIVMDRTSDKLYDSQGNLTTAMLISEVSKGAAFLNFAGHGDTGVGLGSAGWLLRWDFDHLMFQGFRDNDIQLLTNGAKLPVVTTMACSTARFDDVDCVGESWVCRPDKGGIAYFGATRIAWCYVNQWVTNGLLGEIDWRIYQAFYEGYTKLGQMWGIPVTRYVQSHIWNYNYAGVQDVKTLMEFVLLGDPTLRIYNPEHPETLNVPQDFPTIQSAINAAYDGDTVNVSSGIYYENVVVNKSLSLIGQERGSTIIDGNSIGNVLNITAYNVNVSCFTIRDSGKTWTDIGTGVYISGAIAHCNVSGNIIISNGYGIRIDSSPNNTMDGNSMTDDWYGIALIGSSNNNIIQNNVTNDFYGIILDMSSSMNMLRNNQMACYSENFECFNNWGLSSYVNDIDPSNTVDGKPIYYWISKSDDVVPLDAGYVALVNCTRITVLDLSLTRNGQGVLLAYTKDSTITKNNITSNFLGIYTDCSSNNTLSENVINANIDGVELIDSSNNTIVRNSVTANSQGGIYVSGSSGNHIYHNNMNNTEQVLLYNSVNVWDNGYPSGGNYWSDCSGVDANGDGIGDTSYIIDPNNQDNYPLMHPYGSIQNLNTSLVYLTIQSAIDAPETLDGHTVFVRNGTYYEHVVVNKAVSLIGENKRDTILDGNGTGTVLHILRNDVNITGFTIQNSELYLLPNAGIYIDNHITNSHIVKNDIINNGIGVLIIVAWDNCISENNIKNNSDGFLLWSAEYNNMTENNVTNNTRGISLDESPANVFFHNNFVNNTLQVGDATPAHPSVCVWDDGYPNGGNYWSDYNGIDFYQGPHQNVTGSDGIGDSPYVIGASDKDSYPLMKAFPWSEHDIGITHIGRVYSFNLVVLLKTVVGLRFSLNISTFVMNYGNQTETFNVQVYANDTLVGTFANVTLAGRQSAILELRWDTTGFAYGNYTIRAVADNLSGETDTSDNAYKNGMVYVGLPGDMNGDGKVDIRDIAYVAKRFGANPRSSIWNPNADLNDDGKIDIRDIAIAAKHFGEHM